MPVLREKLSAKAISPSIMLSRGQWAEEALGTTWCVAALSATGKREGKTPEQANMKLLTKPVKPAASLFSNLYFKTVKYEEWEPFLSFVDMSYWNVELSD